jgi:hypothetical protein
MGVWGTGVFSDDTAADVRDEYRQCLADGMTGAEATDKLLSSFSDTQDEQDDGPPFWLSLAAVQSRYGRLEYRVRDRALKIIDDGSDLARFSENPKLLRARQRVIEKLRAQLVGPQREAVHVRPEVPDECDWETGEVIGYRRDSGEWLPLHVQGIGVTRRNHYPVVCVLDIPFERIGDADENTAVRRIAALPLASNAPDSLKDFMRLGPCPDCFWVFGLKRRDLGSNRIRRTDKRIPPRVEIKGSGIFAGSQGTFWKKLDSFFDDRLEPAK